MTGRSSAKTGAELQEAVRAAAQDASPKLRLIAEYAAVHPEDFVRMSAREICAHLATSEPTLIRFCRQFGHAGLADFRIELALAMTAQKPGLRFVPTANDRRRVNRNAKRLIGQATLPLVEGDKSLLIDNGSTAEAFSALLEKTPAKTIMTNGLLVAQNALSGGAHRVMLTGGDLLAQSGSLGGRLVERTLQDMHFDTFVMGADSIHLAHGLSTYSESEAHITRAMLERAARVIVLADHSKFRRPGLHRICGAHRVHVLVTDRPLPSEVVERLAELEIELVVACPDSGADHTSLEASA